MVKLDSLIEKNKDLNNRLQKWELELSCVSTQIGKVTASIDEIESKVNKLEYDVSDIRKLTNKIATGFINFYFFSYPKQNYDNILIKSLTSFINTFNVGKQEQYIKEKLAKLGNPIIFNRRPHRHQIHYYQHQQQIIKREAPLQQRPQYKDSYLSALNQSKRNEYIQMHALECEFN